MRHYDPALGRFLSRDLLSKAVALGKTTPEELAARGIELPIHPYVYVNSSPPNHVDPTGLWTISGGGDISFGAGAGGTATANVNIDSSGNANVTITGGGGGVGGVMGGFTFQGTVTNLDSVNRLIGQFEEVTVTIPAFSGTAVFDDAGNLVGFAFNVGTQASCSLAGPVAMNVFVTTTRAISLAEFFDISGEPTPYRPNPMLPVDDIRHDGVFTHRPSPVMR